MGGFFEILHSEARRIAAAGMLVGTYRRAQVGVSKEFPLNRQTRLAVRL
jgi:hypothetical protein